MSSFNQPLEHEMEPTPQLNAALAKAKAEIPTILANRTVKIPTKAGREISFTYAELEEILPAITPILSQYGMAIAHQMGFVEGKYCLISTLRHESGEQLESLFLLPSDFNDPKDLGAKITYGRRYSTLCLLDVTIVEPDSQDWEETKRKIAKEIKVEAGFAQKPRKDKEGSILHDMAGVSPTQTITEPQAKRLWAIARNELHLSEDDMLRVIEKFGYTDMRAIAPNKYDAVTEEIRKYASQKESRSRKSPSDIFEAVHPQDSRVKQIREILNYPRDLVVEWLQFQNVERPSQLEPRIVGELVKTICLTWAADKFDHSNHAANSYQKHVADAVASGADEVVAIRDWVNYVMSDPKKTCTGGSD
ncbi:ERF family protein [Nostoc sp. C057]|uniref:ERF family protein n=1 Tax=Nostoc sp. C057 TaxID=2576903 RepID=UPI0021177F0C|nr:ERF family protein [Nostoc sp. C057]